MPRLLERRTRRRERQTPDRPVPKRTDGWLTRRGGTQRSAPDRNLDAISCEARNGEGVGGPWREPGRPPTKRKPNEHRRRRRRQRQTEGNGH